MPQIHENHFRLLCAKPINVHGGHCCVDFKHASWWFWYIPMDVAMERSIWYAEFNCFTMVFVVVHSIQLRPGLFVQHVDSYIVFRLRLLLHRWSMCSFWIFTKFHLRRFACGWLGMVERKNWTHPIETVQSHRCPRKDLWVSISLDSIYWAFLLEEYLRFIFVSIFNIMAEINNGAIFVLLLPNVIFLALTMYTTEHVNIQNWVRNLFVWMCSDSIPFHSMYTGHDGLGFDCFSYRLHGLLTMLAVHLLSFCNNDNWSHCFTRWYCIQCKLVRLSTLIEKAFHFDYFTLARGGCFQWIWFHLLHAGSSSEGKNTKLFCKIFQLSNVWLLICS